MTRSLILVFEEFCSPLLGDDVQRGKLPASWPARSRSAIGACATALVSPAAEGAKLAALPEVCIGLAVP